MIEANKKDIEKRALIQRELFALTYNMNVKKGKEKTSSELIPFSIDTGFKSTLTNDRINQIKEKLKKARKVWKLPKDKK